MKHEIERLLQMLAHLQGIEADAKADLEASDAYKAVTAAQRSIADTREAIRALLTEPSKVETSAGTVTLVAARSVEYPVDAVRLYAPEVAALVIKTIPAREEVDRTALEKAVKAGMKAGTLAPDTLEKLESKATVKELTPRFTIKLADPVAQELTPF
jgi:stage III sporulation protein SpoIIIAA